MKSKIITAILAIALVNVSQAQQAGDLDSTFAADGIATTNIVNSGNDFGEAIAIQADGRIVVAGATSGTTAYEITVVRYLPNGDPDPAFGTGGLVTTAIGTMDDRAYAVGIQPDGKIVVAGSSFINGTGAGIALARYTADGTLDNTFSGDGKLVDDISAGYDEVFALVLQPDGKILVAGYANNGSNDDFALLRYNPDGTRDNGFSGDGLQITDVAAGNDAVVAMALQPDGFIVVAGYADNGNNEDFALARYAPDGTLDNAFGVNGIVIDQLTTGDDRAYALVVQPDGGIVAGGAASNSLYFTMALVRYNNDGNPDNSFSGDGHMLVPSGFLSVARSMALMPDGRIVAAGSTDVSFMVALINPDGTMDNSFSSDGIQSTSIGDTNYGNAVALQSDGKIVLAGASHFTATLNDFSVARYLTNLNVGILDFTTVAPQVLVYPNPIAGAATLEYTLKQSERITIRLAGADGRIIETYQDGLMRSAGEQRLNIEFSDAIAPGHYVLSIASPSGSVNVQVVKE
ncbi:MAG: hypothetical protein ABI599_09135 [Flavobacteriales bacterium]